MVADLSQVVEHGGDGISLAPLHRFAHLRPGHVVVVKPTLSTRQGQGYDLKLARKKHDNVLPIYTVVYLPYFVQYYKFFVAYDFTVGQKMGIKSNVIYYAFRNAQGLHCNSATLLTFSP